jgi:hypothetical protein
MWNGRAGGHGGTLRRQLLDTVVLGTHAAFLLQLGRLEGFQFRIKASNLDFKRARISAAACREQRRELPLTVKRAKSQVSSQ